MANVKYKEVDLSSYQNAIPVNSSNLRKSIGAENRVGEYYFLKVNSLVTYKNQARKLFDEEEIRQLADTIREHGIRQPLTVIPSQEQEGCFEVISGERRLKAARLAKLDIVPCIIIKDYDKAREIALIENVQRSDLHLVEFAEAVSSLVDSSERGSISEIATKIGKPVSTISEALTIAKLPEEIKAYLIDKNIGSRDRIRKLFGLNQDEMKASLGINTPKMDAKPFSVIRITKDNSGYKIQDRGIKKLSEDDKCSLKLQLQEIVNKL